MAPMAALFGALALTTLWVSSAAVRTLSRDLEVSFKERPVMKVVRLLQDMQAELQKSMDDDKAVHEMLSCWCTENDKEKTQAIEMGTQKSAQLQATMDEATAKLYDLKTKRKSTQEEMYADQKALDQATALNMKRIQAFQKEKTFLLDAISAAKQAIVVLSEHHPELAQLRSAIKPLQDARVAQILSTSSSLRTSQLDALKEFIHKAATAASFLAIPGFQSYRPQSGQIFGILKQMQKDFENSLSAAQKTEAQALADYEALKAAKLNEISIAEKAIVEMDAAIADNQMKHAQALKELEDTQAQLELDKTFLANLKQKCTESDTEFDARMKSRLEEIAAVQDTIKILNADEAFDNFDKTVNVALVQTGSSAVAETHRRQRAASVLQRAAGAQAAPRLAMLAESARLDSFVEVKKAIDKMVAELNEQQADEIKHRDWCIAELNTNKRDTAAADDKKVSLQTKIADLEKTIAALTEDIKSTESYIAEVQEQMKRASEVREAENADYQQTVVDHRLTQAILAKALDRMQQVYALVQHRAGEEPVQPGAPHIETSGNHTDPGVGPARFTKYEQHAGGSKVVQLIKEIIADSKKTEDESITAEEDAQTAYESFMKDSNKELTLANTKVTNLTGARATAKESLSMAETDLKQTMQELEGLYVMNGDLHRSCDFILKNFDARQAARAAEVEALKEAKAILSGMQ